MALRQLLLLGPRRQLLALALPRGPVAPSLATTLVVRMDHRSAFEDKEEALEKQWMHKNNQEKMEKFAQKVAQAEAGQHAAKQELCDILGAQTSPEEVMRNLFEWKERHAGKRLE